MAGYNKEKTNENQSACFEEYKNLTLGTCQTASHLERYISVYISISLFIFNFKAKLQ